MQHPCVDISYCLHTFSTSNWIFIELKLKSIFSCFVFQIRIESPSLSRDNADIKINQTLREVERHIEKIKKYNFK